MEWCLLVGCVESHASAARRSVDHVAGGDEVGNVGNGIADPVAIARASGMECLIEIPAAFGVDGDVTDVAHVAPAVARRPLGRQGGCLFDFGRELERDLVFITDALKAPSELLLRGKAEVNSRHGRSG